MQRHLQAVIVVEHIFAANSRVPGDRTLIESFAIILRGVNVLAVNS